MEVEILDLTLKTPVIMSSMTMSIPAITDEGLMDVARRLKKAGSLMWTDSPIPADLAGSKSTGLPLAADLKPLKDRKKIFDAMEEMEQGLLCAESKLSHANRIQMCQYHGEEFR